MGLEQAERLAHAVKELEAARSAEDVTALVCRTAREIAGSDGSTLVLRDGDEALYADEDAIKPLWKGQRFPLALCVSGWAMMNAQPAMIADIYTDVRIPRDAYLPTFVKSLLMVPIGTQGPTAAIGSYWSEPDRPTDEVLEHMTAFANAVAVAFERVGAPTPVPLA